VHAVAAFFGAILDSLGDVVFWRRLLHNDGRAKRQPRRVSEAQLLNQDRGSDGATEDEQGP
jgi:hypothetical protein